MPVSLDLSPAELDVYARLLHAPGTVSSLGGGPEGPEAVERALTRLLRDGLAVRAPADGDLFVAVPPEVLVQHATAELARSEAVDAQLERLASLVGERGPDDHGHGLVDVVIGEQECRDGFDAVMFGARREVRATESEYTVRVGRPAHQLVHQQTAKGIRFRIIYDHGGFGDPARVADIDREVRDGEIARVFDVPIKIVLTDEPLGWISLRHEAFGNFARLRVRDPLLLEVLGALFEMWWEQALPLPRGGKAVPANAKRTVSDGTLAWLLAAGLSESAIAEYLGCHERTARRYVRDLMGRLDAHTAFQAGYQLVRRGYALDAGAAHA